MAENNTKELDFDRKHEEDLQRLRGLRLLDDDFMQKVFEDKACTEFLLQIILNRTDLKVLRVNGQQDIKNLQGRSVRLDIVAVDADNRVYNIEIQRSDKGAGVKRARYNSSLIDANVTEPGEKYENLCESYVIFITENDVLQRNLPIYNIDRYIGQNMELFNDGSHIIYVNSKIQDDTPLGKLMQDLYCTDPAKLNYKEFAPKMEHLKYSKEGEAQMTDILDFYIAQAAERKAQELAEQKVQELTEQKAQEVAKEAAKEATKNANISIATNLLNSGMSVEFIAHNTKLSIDEVRELAAKLSA